MLTQLIDLFRFVHILIISIICLRSDVMVSLEAGEVKVWSGQTSQMSNQDGAQIAQIAQTDEQRPAALAGENHQNRKCSISDADVS